MDKSRIAKQLSDILPDRPAAPGLTNLDTTELVDREAASIKAKADAKELARLKYIEKSRLKKLEAVEAAESEAIQEQQRRIEAIEAIEAQTVEPLSVTEVAKANGGCTPEMLSQAIQLQGMSRPEMAKLLTSLNINMSIQLTKQDTANLLACLLTCNEAQLAALYNNKRIPIAIKTVIKRLRDDAKLGNMDTIEKLWDRIFGKGQMQLNLPEAQQLQTGIIPNVPISREAYIVIRDTLLK